METALQSPKKPEGNLLGTSTLALLPGDGSAHAYQRNLEPLLFLSGVFNVSTYS